MVCVLIAIDLVHTDVAAPTELTGFVRTVAGRPIPKATVMADGLSMATTNDNGWYRLVRPTSVISFRAKGFRPLSVVRHGQINLDVTLNAEINSHWNVPGCPLVNGSDLIGHGHMRFRVSDRFRIERVHDLDFVNDVVYREESQDDKLVLTAGATCCRGRPPERLYITSREFSERAWSGKQMEGLERPAVLHGMAKDGGGLAHYSANLQVMSAYRMRRQHTWMTLLHRCALRIDWLERKQSKIDRVDRVFSWAVPMT